MNFCCCCCCYIQQINWYFIGFCCSRFVCIHHIPLILLLLVLWTLGCLILSWNVRRFVVVGWYNEKSRYYYPIHQFDGWHWTNCQTKYADFISFAYQTRNSTYNSITTTIECAINLTKSFNRIRKSIARESLSYHRQ